MNRNELDWEYHWCNDHAPHATDPYKHRHQWEYIGIHPLSGDVLYKCKFDITVCRVTPERVSDG